MVETDCEDDASTAQHIAAMKREMAKSAPDVTFIHDRMIRTFSARRKFVQDSLLVAALEEYPALTLDSVVSSNLRCYSHVMIDIQTYLCPAWIRGTPVHPFPLFRSFPHFVLFSFSFSSFLIVPYLFLLLSIPSSSSWILPVRFQAGGRRKRLNWGLVCLCMCLC